MSRIELSTEEKKKIIDDLINTHQNYCIFVKTLLKDFTVCSQATLSTWIKTIYNFSGGLTDFFISRGVIYSEDKYLEFAEKTFKELEDRYKSKKPAKDQDALVLENLDLAVKDFLYVAVGYSLTYGFDTLRLFNSRIIEDPFDNKEKIESFLNNIYELKDQNKFLSLEQLLESCTFTKFKYEENVLRYGFSKVEELMGMPIKQYFIEKEILMSEKEVDDYYEEKLNKGPVMRGKPYETFDEYANNQYHDDTSIIDFLEKKAVKIGLTTDEIHEYVIKRLVDSNFIGKVKEKEELKPEKTEKEEFKGFNIYSNIDNINIDVLKEKANVKEIKWPKNKTYICNVDGKEIKVVTKFSYASRKFSSMFNVRDMNRAILEMKSREEIQNEILEEDPNMGTDAYFYAMPEFSSSTPCLNDEEIKIRCEFIQLIANLINNEETFLEIAKCAQKKKNGTLYKNRILKIAGSGIAGDLNKIYAIIGRAKNDTELDILFEDRGVSQGEMCEWNCDFISTYHEGLLISNALEEAL